MTLSALWSEHVRGAVWGGSSVLGSEEVITQREYKCVCVIQGCYMCDSRKLYILNRSLGRGLLNKPICYKTVLLLVLSPLPFCARDLEFSYLGNSVRTNKHVVWIDQKVYDAIRLPKLECNWR